MLMTDDPLLTLTCKSVTFSGNFGIYLKSQKNTPAATICKLKITPAGPFVNLETVQHQISLVAGTSTVP